MNEQNINFWRLKKFSLLYSYYAYFDVKEYYADNIFIDRKLEVKFLFEYGKENERYVIIFCKIRKRDASEFESAMNDLENKMLLCGFYDYMEHCQNLKQIMEEQTVL
jgi:hypothetical protein